MSLVASKPSLQRKFVLPGEQSYCALATISTARAILPGHDEDDILALIEEGGELSWAWDISLAHVHEIRRRRETTASREVRILTACVTHYAQTGKPLDWSLDRVLKEILRGSDKPFLTGTRVQIILNCGSTHVMNLISARALKVLPGTTWNTGPQGSPVINRDSFVQFLKIRRMP